MSEFETIMTEITGGLTGYSEKDARYLMDQMEKYKTHEMAKEILRACGRLFYNCTTEEQRAEFSQFMNNRVAMYESVMEEAQFKIHQKKFGEAYELMKDLIRQIEEMHMFTDDKVSEYHCFNEFFEEVLYRENTRPEKELRSPSMPLDRIYLLYGSLLIDLNRFDDARAALETAMHWNPADADIAFEHAEIFKKQGDIESFFRLTLDAFKYSFRTRQVARCFRNLGYYFSENEKWQEATACYMLSLQYERDSKSAMSELYYIQQKAGSNVPKPDLAYIKECAEQYGFPAGADPDVLGLSYAYGKHFAENGNTDGARYCWEITYELTDDPDIKELLDKLPAE